MVDSLVVVPLCPYGGKPMRKAPVPGRDEFPGEPEDFFEDDWWECVC